jgi:hypothetical protein
VFRPRVNEPSTIIAESDFKLMGDISEVCSTTTSLIEWLPFPLMQLKLIPIPTDDVIKYSKLPSVVVINGSVTFVDNAHDYFCLTPSQYVSGGTQNDGVPVRTILNRETLFAPQNLFLPDINCLVGCTGRLLAFEMNAGPGTGNGLCAKVSVDTIIQLPECADRPGSKKTTDSRKVADDEDSVALKDRVRKYVEKPSNKQCGDKDWPIASSKTKHKVTLSLDGVAGGKAEQGEKKRK